MHVLRFSSPIEKSEKDTVKQRREGKNRQKRCVCMEKQLLGGSN